MLAHRGQHMFSGAFVVVIAAGLFDKAVATGCLDEGYLQFRANLAEFDDVFVLQVIGLENNLENCTVVEARLVDCVDVSAGKVTIAPQGFTDIDDHVNLGGGVANGLFGFGNLYLGGVVAMREADNGENFDTGAL